MIFTTSPISGLVVIEPEPVGDERGFFSRIVCGREFSSHGLTNDWAQQNISYNKKRATLRGMHYQTGGAAETKVIRCTRGSIYDVAVDIREDSPTYLRWHGVTLSAENHVMFYIPAGFAHGYITMTDDAEIHYLVSAYYTPGAERGIRYDDPAVGIEWPMKPLILSEKDRSWPLVDNKHSRHIGTMINENRGFSR